MITRDPIQIFRGGLGIPLMGLLFWMACPPAAAQGPLADRKNTRILLSADDEGQTLPCSHCPAASARGGLARRSTAIAQLRREHPLLLLDAGNALFGGDSAGGDGRVIVAAFNAMQYDVVNASYREFRYGRQTTLRILREASFSTVSANLLDEQTGKLLFAPYVLKQLGGQKVAIVGVTEPPAGYEQLPHLRAQLAGIRIRPVNEALEQWLATARTETDRVILLYYGSLDDAKAVRRRFGGEVEAIGIGGIRPQALDEDPADPGPPLIASDRLGKTLADGCWDEDGRWKLAQVAIDASLPEDPGMQEVLDSERKSTSENEARPSEE